MSGGAATEAATPWTPARLLGVFCLLTLLQNSCLAVPMVQVDESPKYQTLPLASSVIGPESLAFDPRGGGPYTGVSDGRVLRWFGPVHGWREFSRPARRRGVAPAKCGGTNSTAMEDKCGRPLGIQFHAATGDLYIADAYFGLLRVGRTGGVATKLASAAEGVPFTFLNGLDVDQQTGKVYFTDSSTNYQRREWIWCILTSDATGRFMSYDPSTNQVKVLLRNLEFANGVALSKDASFALVAESTKRRVLRYWLKGPRADSSEVFANVSGYPDNVRRTAAGDFWVGINTGKGKIEFQADGAREGKQVGMPVRSHGAMDWDTVAVRFDVEGRVLEELRDNRDDGSLSEVAEHNGALWMGSAVSPYVGIIRRQ